MENVLSQFKSDFFEVTLNSDQLFVHTSISEEVFALRSINGISIVDLVDEYNTELTAWKKKANTPYYMYLFGGFFLLIDIVAVVNGGFGNGNIIPSIVIGIALIYFGYKKQNKSKTEKPNLMSSLRIMLNGGVKDFKFDKADSSSANIADFVTQVVKTLTAYHKNNG